MLQMEKPMLYWSGQIIKNEEFNMDNTNMQIEADEAVKRVVEYTNNILKQKPSDKLVNALKEIKDKEDAAKNKKVAVDRDAEA